MRSKILIRIVSQSIVLLALVFSATLARADGGIFPPDRYYSQETSQKAFIYYQNQMEDLVVSTSFRGNSDKFAWVVPTPSQPEINKSDSALFTKLNEIVVGPNTGPDIVYSLGGATSTPKNSAVQVVEQKTVDIYDTAVLKASDQNALANWLKDNNYSYPTDQSDLLQSYIDNNWYFTVAKIQNALAGNANIQSQLSSGTLTPLRLTFKTDKIIYPMLLTKATLLANQSKTIYLPPVDMPTNQVPVIPAMSINLYVLTDSKISNDQLDISWGNWLSQSDLNSLKTTADSSFIPASGRLFLTQLKKNDISISDVKSDFTLQKAADNNVYPVSVYQTTPFWLTNLIGLIVTILVAVLFPIGLLFILALLLQRFVNKKWLFVVCFIYEIITIVIIALTWPIVLISHEGSFASFFEQTGMIGFTLGMILLLITSIFLTAKMYKRHKKV